MRGLERERGEGKGMVKERKKRRGDGDEGRPVNPASAQKQK